MKGALDNSSQRREGICEKGEKRVEEGIVCGCQ